MRSSGRDRLFGRAEERSLQRRTSYWIRLAAGFRVLLVVLDTRSRAVAQLGSMVR